MAHLHAAADGHRRPLRYTYLAWAPGVVILYFPCGWFAALKAQGRDWWLSYL